MVRHFLRITENHLVAEIHMKTACVCNDLGVIGSIVAICSFKFSVAHYIRLNCQIGKVRCQGRGSTFFPAAQLHCSFISVIFGILVRLFADDPRFTKGKEPDKTATQGVSGSFPWSVLSFALMWLEFASFSHKKTDSLISLLIVGNSFGCLFGGRVGDILSQQFSNSGRIILAQISSASAIPFGTLLLQALKDDPSTTFAHAVVLSVMGYFISWNGPATNKYIS
ncbi:uncharacterized protein [Rutidosis leptorrhynchoides]|uniref:uncharacterized protein n=1 Tax=Rutidosis leptorrhynchoides TaxID=125765 RepID=UPI003A99BE2E